MPVHLLNGYKMPAGASLVILLLYRDFLMRHMGSGGDLVTICTCH